MCFSTFADYIHFQQFVTREETMGGEDINSKVARLTVLVTATLVLVVLLLLAMVAAFLIFYWHRRRQLLSPPDYSKSPPSPGAAEHGKMNGLKIEMPPPPPPSTTTAPPPITPATTSTPLSTRPRYPKEDPTLEYGAYDNPALTPSPVFENNKDSTPTATTTPVSRRQESSF
ncbi:hypothetical protein C0J52_06419 [Blattella germanica]|nr:hypothetical protein C0J52_06419 [Blattella germanica]